MLEALAAELSRPGIAEVRLRAIVDTLFQDGDDPDHRLSNGSVLALTPAERALRCVGKVLRRLRERALADRPEVRAPYLAADLPQLQNLRSLLSLALDRSRPLSTVETARLFQQWSVLALHCDRMASQVPDEGVWERAHARRRQLEAMCEAVGPVGEPELAITRTRVCYGRAMAALYHQPPAFHVALGELQQLLGAHHTTIPRGLYLHIMLAFERMLEVLGGLQWGSGRRALAHARLPLALAFGTMPPSRVLDRMGVLHLLSLDCLWANAPTSASQYLSVADLLAGDIVDDGSATEWARRRLARSASQLRRLGRLEVVQLLSSQNEAPSPLLAPVHAILGTDLRETLARDQAGALAMLRDPRFECDVRSELYRDVLQSWIEWSNEDPVGCRGPAPLLSFDKRCQAVLSGPFRADAIVGRLLCIGQIRRLLAARSNEDIDGATRAFDGLVTLSVLVQDWQGLVDTIGSLGHLNFLERKLAFFDEAERLRLLSTYFERVFSMSVRHPKEQAVQAILEELTGCSHGRDAAILRSDITVIEQRWRAVARGREESVQEWARQFGRAARRGDFVPTSPERRVAAFFDDVARLEELGADLWRLEARSPTEAWDALAWSSYNLGRIFRWASREHEARTWITRGLKAATEAVARATGCYQSTRQNASLLHRSIDVRQRLLRMSGMEPSEEDRRTLLRLAAARLKSTRFVARRSRATAVVEVSVAEFLSRSWCASRRSGVPLREIYGLFSLIQRLKVFNYGLLHGNPDGGGGDNVGLHEEARDEGTSDDVAEVAEETPDIFERREAYAGREWNRRAEGLLERHLREEDAAILEFVSHAGSRSAHFKDDLRCIVIRARNGALTVRPVVLSVPERLVKEVVAGGDGSTEFAGGLEEHLPRWPVEPPSDLPNALRELAAGVFSEELLEEMTKVRRLYLCPHRHLFQVPLHALQIGGRPVYKGWDVSYATKTDHIVSLLEAQGRNRSRASRADVWSLVDTDDSALRGLARQLSDWTVNNQWGTQYTTSDELLRQAAQAETVLVLCHGQADRDRPGASRLRLWRGGRLLADDLHRARADFGTTDWIIGACDTGRARIGMQTGPGFALGLVTRGARRVTSCIYRVTPGTAARFVSALLEARDQGSRSAFSRACRTASESAFVNGWADAAAFTSYGLFGR